VKIEVFGTGCPKCRGVEQNVVKALEQTGLKAEVVKVTDIGEIVDRGLMSTPGLAIDGEVVAAGRIPTVEEIVQMVKERA
jgi:small redox-active disulfide protein 2